MRIVVKIGTSTLTYQNGKMNLRRIEELARTLADVSNAGNEVILVSSGAIASGASKLRLSTKPQELSLKQAAAAVGQCELMYVYDRTFINYDVTVAQILVTREDLSDEIRHSNFSNTVEKLISLGVLPIINENDTVSTNEISVGDNDTLGALVAQSVKADLLVLLSDIDGLYTADPHTDLNAKLVPLVEEITPEIEASAGGKGSEFSTGGMATKLHAAKICMESGVTMIIANGESPSIIYDAVDGKPVGTKFLSNKKRV